MYLCDAWVNHTVRFNSDCSRVVTCYPRGPSFARKHSRTTAGLWRGLSGVIQNVCKVKAHLKRESVPPSELVHWHGNDWADKLAKDAASYSQQPQAVIKEHVFHFKQAVGFYRGGCQGARGVALRGRAV